MQSCDLNLVMPKPCDIFTRLPILTQTTTRPGVLPSRPSPQGDGALRKWCSSAALPHRALPLPLPRARRQRTLAEANCTDTGRTWPAPTDNRDFSRPQHIHSTPARGWRRERSRSGSARSTVPSRAPPGRCRRAEPRGQRGDIGYRRHPRGPAHHPRPGRALRPLRTALPRSVTRSRPRRARGGSRRGLPRSRPCPRRPRARCPGEAGGLVWVERQRLPSG